MTETAPEAAYTYDVDTDLGMVRFLLSDVGAPWVFTDTELAALMRLEGSVKRAAAQAIDANATNEALASKVLRDADGKSTDGAKVADAMRKHAAELRRQADREDEDTDDGFFFDVVDLDTSPSWPERTARPL